MTQFTSSSINFLNFPVLARKINKLKHYHIVVIGHLASHTMSD